MKRTKRLLELAARVGEQVTRFEEITLKNDGPCCDYPSYRSSGPTLYVGGRKDSKVYDLPKEGEARIKFRMRSKGVDYDENGGESYRTDIEVKSIEPVNLSAILEKYDFSDRARDTGGRYAPGQDVSPDEMADAYLKPKKKKNTAVLAGAGVAGVTAAAIGSRSPAVAQGVGRLLRRV